MAEEIVKEAIENDDAYPRYFYNKITDITIDDLKKMGVKAITVDLDNTTVKDFTLKILRGVRRWMQEVQDNGYPIVIVTNTFTLRAWYISRKMGNIPFFAMAKKPKPNKIISAAAYLGVEPSEIVHIGDLLFADVIAANRCGAISVKVEPYAKEKVFAKKYRHIRRREREYLERRRKRRGN